MGYTHYYRRRYDAPEWKKAWKQLVKDVPTIIHYINVPLQGPNTLKPLADPQTLRDDEIEPPAVNDDIIELNGVGEDAHEPLVLTKRPWCKGTDGWAGWFIKTAHKDYDEVVACILLRAYMLAPNSFILGSDGDWDNEWKVIRDDYKVLFKEEPRCPWAPRSESQPQPKPEPSLSPREKPTFCERGKAFMMSLSRNHGRDYTRKE